MKSLQFYFFLPYCRSDSAYFDGLDETILCVGLVKAKPGIVHVCQFHYFFILFAADVH